MLCQAEKGWGLLSSPLPTPLWASFLSLWMPVALPLQPQPRGRCMIRGMMSGHQASTGIAMMTSTGAGQPWAGWPSCSGTWDQVGQERGMLGTGRWGGESQRPWQDDFMIKEACPG